MPASRSGTLRDVEVEPDLALRRHLRRRGRQPGRAEVLQRDEQPAVEQLERALEQLRLLERVADLDRRALARVLFAQLGGGEHGGAADPVAPRARAEQDDDVADARGGRADQLLGLDQPEAHRVDQAVLLVGGLEVDLAADRGDADRVAVVADAGDRAVEQVARAGGVAGSPKRSESSMAIGRAPTANTSRRMPPTPVAAPWNGSTALGWLCDSTLNAHASPPPTSTAPAFSPGPMTTRGPSVGQRLEQLARVLVAAVLGPHEAEDRQLDLVGLAPHERDDAVVLGVGEPELAVAAHAATRAADSNSRSPSAEPVSGSTACSGCGIRPTTLPACVAHARDVARRAVEGLARSRSGARPGRSPRARRAPGRAPSSGRSGAWPGSTARRPPRTRRSTSCRALTTSSATWRQTNRSDVFGSSAPGSSPASHSTWKPLQMPSTSPPWRAKRSTSSMIGEKRASAPARR